MDDELIEYVQCPLHDVLLLQWHAHMQQTGDAALVLPNETICLSEFYKYMLSAKLVFKVTADSGIWYAAWLRPALGGAQFDMWVAPDRRSGKGWLYAMEQALEYGFERYNEIGRAHV